MAIVAGASLMALMLARQRYGDARPKDWQERERASPLARLAPSGRAPGASLVARGVGRLRATVGEIDHWVIEGIVGAVAVAVRVAAWSSSKLDTHFVGGVTGALAERAARAVEQRRRGVLFRLFFGVLLALALLLAARPARANVPGTLAPVETNGPKPGGGGTIALAVAGGEPG